MHSAAKEWSLEDNAMNKMATVFAARVQYLTGIMLIMLLLDLATVVLAAQNLWCLKLFLPSMLFLTILPFGIVLSLVLDML